jgi:hypothetical protein
VYVKRRGEEIEPSHYAKKIRYGRRESAVKAVDAPDTNPNGRPYSGDAASADGAARMNK